MNIFITGSPGCGKSSLVNSIVKELEKRNKKIAGIITPEIRKNNIRIGFKIIDLASKKEEILASVHIRSKTKISKYFVNIEGIDKITNKFLESADNAEIIIIDELGPMELFSDNFKSMLEKIFMSEKKIIAVIHRDLADKYKNKGKLFWLERKSFDKIKEEILKLL